MRLRAHAGALQRRLNTAAMPLPIEARNGRTAPPLGCKEKRHWPARRQTAGKTTLARKAANGWKRPFNDPIPLPRGRRLVTLEDAGRYITKLPKAEHEAAEWQAAKGARILGGAAGGPTMCTPIGGLPPVRPHRVRATTSDPDP